MTVRSSEEIRPCQNDTQLYASLHGADDFTISRTPEPAADELALKVTSNIAGLRLRSIYGTIHSFGGQMCRLSLYMRAFSFHADEMT